MAGAEGRSDMLEPTPKLVRRLSRRSVLKGGLASGFLWGLSPHLAGCSKARSWVEADLTQLREALDQGTLSAIDLLRQCLARIEERNPVLSCMLEVNLEAESAARQAGTAKTGLSGIPLLLKGNMATADRMSTTAGSAALAGSRYPQDAAVVGLLRQSGAVLVGKANMSEWSNLRTRNSTSGWSALGGQCRNPHSLGRSPSGSSSGSAAAVAAGLVPLALGTEMMGSITCPASACGVVGLKPTLGLVPTEGIIPCAASFDCVGPLTRTVADAAIALQVLAGGRQDYVKTLRRGALKGSRIGVARQDWGFDWRVDQLMEENLAVLSRLGAELVDPVAPPRFREVFADFDTVWKAEFRHGLNQYLANQAPEVKVRSLADVITFNLDHPEQEAMADLGQDLLTDAQAGCSVADGRYLEARQRLFKASGRERLESLCKASGLSAIVAPTLGPAWTIDFVNGDHFEGSGSAPPALAGCPHITVPGGLVQGLPVGFSFYGPALSESTLLALAYDFEQETQHRVVPTMGP